MDITPIKKQEISQLELQRFADVITHDYLHELSECEIRQPATNGVPPVRWYKITKLVLDKDVFFTDTMSMLYTSLHGVARNVSLVIDKNAQTGLSIYLGARDYDGNKNVSGEVLKSAIQGYLPGASMKKPTAKLPDLKYNKVFVSSVSAMASLHDDKKQHFVQGIERLINATNQVPRFRAYFIADNVSHDEARSIIDAFNDLRTNLSPLSEVQWSFSESHADGVSKSVSENFSKSISKSLSNTITHTEGTSSSKTDSTNKSGTFSLIVISGSYSKSHAEQKGKSKSTANARQEGTTTGQQEGHGQQEGSSETDTQGKSCQITYQNAQVKRCVDIIDKQTNRIGNGIPFGLWSASTYFTAPTKTEAIRLANIYRGCIIGENSNLESCAVNFWEDRDKTSLLTEKYLEKSIQPRYDFRGLDVSAGVVVTSEELAVQFSLPQSSVPGFLVREEKSFGRNVIANYKLTDDNSISIGHILHLGEKYDEELRLGIDGLSKHTLVTGTTGSGKSNTLYLLLSEIKKKYKFLVIEPAKGEYKNVFGMEDDVTVYGSNPKISKLLTLNPFIFPANIDIYSHIDSLVEIFSACWPMYAAMPQVLKHAIIEAYLKCGWNLDKSQNTRGIYPTIVDVLDSLKDYINSSEYSSETKGDYKGSLETRLQSLCEGVVGRILNGIPVADQDLFNENVIIDLSHINSSESRSLLMGLIILKLNEFRNAEDKGMNQTLRHVTVLEEAHNLLKRTSTTQVLESSNIAGMAVEKISNSMAEMRTFGEGFVIVDQSPAMLDLAAIRNTNTKIILQLPEKDDREAAGKSIGLDNEQVLEISRLKTGEAIVYQSGWEEAVKTQINLYDTKNQIPWHYDQLYFNHLSPSREMFDILYNAFIKSNYEVTVYEFRETVLKSNLPGSVKITLLDKLANINKLTRECVADLFVDIIGIGAFQNMSKQKDIISMNIILRNAVQRVIDKYGTGHLEAFERMYVYGADIRCKSQIFEKWSDLTLKNK